MIERARYYLQRALCHMAVAQYITFLILDGLDGIECQYKM